MSQNNSNSPNTANTADVNRGKSDSKLPVAPAQVYLACYSSPFLMYVAFFALTHAGFVFQRRQLSGALLENATTATIGGMLFCPIL